MHDAIACEKAGTPALGVMTSKFVNAAELMARVLGMPDYAFPVIGHPVSSATDSELEEKARSVLASVSKLKIHS